MAVENISMGCCTGVIDGDDEEAEKEEADEHEGDSGAS